MWGSRQASGDIFCAGAASRVLLSSGATLRHLATPPGKKGVACMCRQQTLAHIKGRAHNARHALLKYPWQAGTAKDIVGASPMRSKPCCDRPQLHSYTCFCVTCKIGPCSGRNPCMQAGRQRERPLTPGCRPRARAPRRPCRRTPSSAAPSASSQFPAAASAYPHSCTGMQ